LKYLKIRPSPPQNIPFTIEHDLHLPTTVQFIKNNFVTTLEPSQTSTPTSPDRGYPVDIAPPVPATPVRNIRHSSPGCHYPEKRTCGPSPQPICQSFPCHSSLKFAPAHKTTHTAFCRANQNSRFPSPPANGKRGGRGEGGLSGTSVRYPVYPIHFY